MPYLFHSFVSAKTDESPATGRVRPVDWNDALQYGNAAGNAPSGTDAVVRQVLLADQDYFVATTGSDSNPGTVGSPFLTIQKALNTATFLDCNSFGVSITVGVGTFTEDLVVNPLLNSLQPILLYGFDTTGSTILNSTTGQAVTINPGARIELGNVKVQTSGGGSTGVFADQSSVFFLGSGMVFGATVQHHMFLYRCQYYAGDDYSIVGGGATHFLVSSGTDAYDNGLTATLTGSLNFSSAFIQCDTCAQFLGDGTYDVSGATITGKRYIVASNGIIRVTGASETFFPGDVAGTFSTGGQYSGS